MSRMLVTYFSAEGTTAKVAAKLAFKLAADVFEIKPEKPYTKADLRWTNPLARCNKEKFGNKEVPVEGKVDQFDQYDTILIGFPIWYGGAPNVVNTFVSGYDWNGKKIILFATSGGSGIGKTAEKLKPYLNGKGEIAGARLIKGADDLEKFVQEVKSPKESE